MPICFDPNNTVRVFLDYDAATHPDEKTRPAFIVKFPTARERVKVWEIFKEHDAEPDGNKKLNILAIAAKVVVLRVENMPGGIDLDATLEKLSSKELNELTDKMLSATKLSEDDRSKLDAGPHCAGQNSAASAAAPAAA